MTHYEKSYQQAREMRRIELERLWSAAVCGLRQAFARLARRPVPACPPRSELPA